MATFYNCPLLWVSKPHIEIYLSTVNSAYVELSHYVRDLLLLGILIKEVIGNLVIYSYNLKFVSISTVYGENNGEIIVEISLSMTLISNHISVRYHVEKEIAIWNIKLENQKAEIFNKY